MSASQLRIEVLPATFFYHRLRQTKEIPHCITSRWSFGFRGDKESCLLCESPDHPDSENREGPFHGMRIKGQLDFGLVGIVANLAALLAAEKIPVLVQSTFDTDYLFVPIERSDDAIKALQAGGIRIERRDAVTRPRPTE